MYADCKLGYSGARHSVLTPTCYFASIVIAQGATSGRCCTWRIFTGVSDSLLDIAGDRLLILRDAPTSSPCHYPQGLATQHTDGGSINALVELHLSVKLGSRSCSDRGHIVRVRKTGNKAQTTVVFARVPRRNTRV